jgi:hypothetical protein
MSTYTVYTTKKTSDVLREVRELPGSLAGRRVTLAGNTYRSYLMQSIWKDVSKAFVTKSKGGEDESGESWHPLSPATIAQRPIGAVLKLRKGITGKRVRGLLTPSQDRRWRGIFRSTYLRLVSRLGKSAALAKAGEVAWAILKSEGAKTKLQVFGTRKVRILVVTGRLEASVQPGQVGGSVYKPPREQESKFDPGTNRLVMRSLVPYADAQNKTRRIFPTQSQLKTSGWLDQANKVATDKTTKYLAESLR